MAAQTWGDWSEARRRAATPGTLARGPLLESLTTWRRTRRLLSVDETRAWLDRWDIALDDLQRHLGATAVEPSCSDKAIWAESVCSGLLPVVARRLALRVALLSWDGNELNAEAVRALDDDYDRWRRTTEPTLPVPEIVAAHAAEWTRLDLRVLTLLDAETAREAGLCVRVDGLSLDAVATLSGGEMTQQRSFLGDMEPSLHTSLQGAEVGTLIGPVSHGRGHILVEVLAHDPADLADPSIEARARHYGIARALALALQGVLWHDEVPRDREPFARDAEGSSSPWTLGLADASHGAVGSTGRESAPGAVSGRRS